MRIRKRQCDKGCDGGPVPVTDSLCICSCQVVMGGRAWNRDRRDPKYPNGERKRPLKPFNKYFSYRTISCDVLKRKVPSSVCEPRAKGEVEGWHIPKACFGCPQYAVWRHEKGPRDIVASGSHNWSCNDDIERTEQLGEHLWIKTVALDGSPCFLRLTGKYKVVPLLEGYDKGLTGVPTFPRAYYVLKNDEGREIGIRFTVDDGVTYWEVWNNRPYSPVRARGDA